ncbi:MAG: PAS domain-containing protein [Gemmatimonadota bacterium]|nr:PAS domain-containing protein [Gemmatimonadota bacterium]MDH5759445.1 PAS domain-containing protein [Gemmatimonadota bacterium]
MITRRKAPLSQESEFALGELFFSTTDKTGRIRGGNDVFRRVAKYSLEEMIGEPHSLVRHPDMPRAIFHLLWEYIQAGKPIAAYVNNMASDGSYYWVVATVVPIPGHDGYLSVRMKPTSDLFPVMMDAYARLRAIEREYEERGDRRGGLQASVEQLGPLLQSLGFDDYDQFMYAMLPREIRLRQEGMRELLKVPSEGETSSRSKGHLAKVLQGCIRIEQLLDRQFGQLDAFIALSAKLDDKSRFVRGLAGDVRLVSMNATSASRRMSGAGVTLGVVAHTMGFHAEESAELATTLERYNAAAAAALRESAFLIGVAKLQTDMVRIFVEEIIEVAAGGGTDHRSGRVANEGLEALVVCLAHGVRKLFETYRGLIDRLDGLTVHLAELYRLIQMLEITHLTGRVEASKIEGADEFDALFSQVSRQVQLARSELRDFGDAVEHTRGDVARLARVEPEILRHLDEIARLSSTEEDAREQPVQPVAATPAPRTGRARVPAGV